MTLPLIPLEVYCCDLDAMMQLYTAKLFHRLRRLARDGRLRIPEGIHREARTRHPKIFSQLQKWNRDYHLVAFLNDDQRARGLVPNIEQQYGPPFGIGGVRYGGFWASARGRKAADGQLVALAKANGWFVISNDVSVHGACFLENVECHRWEYLARLIK